MAHAQSCSSFFFPTIYLRYKAGEESLFWSEIVSWKCWKRSERALNDPIEIRPFRLANRKKKRKKKALEGRFNRRAIHTRMQRVQTCLKITRASRNCKHVFSTIRTGFREIQSRWSSWQWTLCHRLIQLWINFVFPSTNDPVRSSNKVRKLRYSGEIDRSDKAINVNFKKEK